MSYAFYDIVGNRAVILIIGSHFLIQIGKLSATGLARIYRQRAGA